MIVATKHEAVFLWKNTPLLLLNCQGSGLNQFQSKNLNQVALDSRLLLHDSRLRKFLFSQTLLDFVNKILNTKLSNEDRPEE